MKLNFLFPEGRGKALTFSYDDGCIYDRKLIEIFDRYGMKGTFNLNSGLMGKGRRLSESEIRELYKNHEIACHGLNHETMPKLSLLSAVEEILEDRKNLERISGKIVRGMAYAYGARSPETDRLLASLGIAYARRTCEGSFGIPDDFLEWQTTCHHAHALLEKGEAFLKLKSKLFLMYVWGHSYEFEDQGNWDIMERFCAKMAGQEDIWYATNIEICEYLKATKEIVTSADCRILYNPTALTLWGEWGEERFRILPGETLRKE
ncbi:MAG: polysaccharide deacetylase family protein [Lentisphaeria bacterium]|nr:polysaccharide deacetylase family protein [Lentisphaeria bacterium]